MKKFEQESEFDKFYYYEILPILRQYEKIRKGYFNKFLIVEFFILFIVTIIVAIILFIWSFWEINTWTFAIFIFCLAFGVTSLYGSYKDYIMKIKYGIKEKCSQQLKKCFKNINWGHTNITLDLIRQSKLFNTFSNIIYDDLFLGNYKDVKFSVNETFLISSNLIGFNSNIFRGIIIAFNSNKKIKAHTIVANKCDISFSIFYNNELFNKVKLEDLNFDKRFSVYSEDQIEARYLITPAFMERLNNLRTAFGTKKIKCAFFDDEIVFAISTNKDLFEMGSFHRTLVNKKKVKEFYDEITAIYAMIDHFKLNERTGL